MGDVPVPVFLNVPLRTDIPVQQATASDVGDNSASRPRGEVVSNNESSLLGRITRLLTDFEVDPRASVQSVLQGLQEFIEEVLAQYAHRPEEMENMLSRMTKEARNSESRLRDCSNASRHRSRSEAVSSIVREDVGNSTQTCSPDSKRGDIRTQSDSGPRISRKEVVRVLKEGDRELSDSNVDIQETDDPEKTESDFNKLKALNDDSTRSKATPNNSKTQGGARKTEVNSRSPPGRNQQRRQETGTVNAGRQLQNTARTTAGLAPPARERNSAVAVAETKSSLRRKQDNNRARDNKTTQRGGQITGPKVKARGMHQDEIDSLRDTIANLQLQLDEADAANVDLRRDSGTTQARLEQQITDQADQMRKLHSVLMSQGGKSDFLDDEAVRMEFSRLETSVQRLVKKHFPVARWTGYSEYNQIEDQEDRVYFLRATICSLLAEEFFSPGAKHFGIDDSLDKTLANFEETVERSDNAKGEASVWRVQTLRVARLVEPCRPTGAVQHVEEQIKLTLRSFLCDDETWSSQFLQANRALCEATFNLAVSIRMCQSEFLWDQLAPPSSFSDVSVEWIDGYDKFQPGEPAKVLFGPVYKIVKGERVTLRSGEVLRG